MKFGCVAEKMLSGISWELPADPPRTQALLATSYSPTQPPSVHIGCSVWADAGFVGNLYPQGTPSKDFLRVYSQQFNTVELNTTFYSIPSVAKVTRWKEAVGPGFRFCPKISRSISHSNNLDKQRRLLDIFIDAVLHFDANLGVTFMQLSPYFHPRSMGGLQQLLACIPQGFELAIELRHPAWFSDVEARQALFDLLHAQGITGIITDAAGRRDVLHQVLTTRCAFIRFNGNNLHATDYVRLDAWVAKLCQWLSSGLTTIYFMLHEPEKAHAATLAVYMIRKLNALTGLKLTPPILADQ